MHHAEHRATHQVSTTQYPSYPPQVSSIQFIVEGQNKLIVAGGWNRKVVVWRDDEESSSLIGSDRCMSGHGEDILSIAYSSEGGGNLLATSGYDGRVLVWNMDSGVVKFTLTIARVETMEVDSSHVACRPWRPDRRVSYELQATSYQPQATSNKATGC